MIQAGQGIDWRSKKKPRNRKLEMMRRAKTAQDKFGINGRRKEKFAPRPVTLPKLPWDGAAE